MANPSRKATESVEPSFDEMVAMLERAKASGLAHRDKLQADIEAAAEKRREAIEKAEAAYSAAVEAKQAELADLNAKLEKLGIAPPAMATDRKAPGDRAARGSVQAKVLQVISEDRQGGLTRAMILTRMGATADKSMASSISNALVSLKKAGKVMNESGYYSIPVTTDKDHEEAENTADN